MTSENLVINIGPQHPSTHGGLHVEAELSGEIVKKATVHLGYVHRGMEYLAEQRTYQHFIPFTSRLDYLASQLPTWGYCLAVEKLAGIEVPERAEYIRVIMGELSRIASHLLFFGSFCIDLGATTALIYAFRDREKILKLFEITTGSRMITTYMRFGGVAEDLPDEFFPAVRQFLAEVPAHLEEYHTLVSGNEMFRERVMGVGRLSSELAIDLGVTGPNLRATGIAYDLRKVEPYSIYDRFNFNIPVKSEGDCWARYLIRLEEISESASIIEQALKNLPDGEFKGKVPRSLKPAAGEAYTRIESAKGELGYYLLSDGTDKPYRLHIHGPSFVNLRALEIISEGYSIQDLVANLASLDPVLGESDR
ncbi:MAG: NADH-quinone oxidoreductase subunit D [Methylocystaceae bacterium]